MEKLSTRRCRLLYTNYLAWLVVAVSSLFYTENVLAQVTTAACNTSTSLTSGSFANLSVASSQVPVFGGDEFANKGRVIDNDSSSAATFLAALGSSAWIEVTDNAATSANVYPAGTYAGFIINSTSVGARTTIELFNGTSNTPVTSKTFTNLADVGLVGGVAKVGVVATEAFNRIRITYGGVVGTISVYYPFVQRFCGPSPSLACNTVTTPTNPTHPVFVNPDNTGFGGTANVGTINNQDAAVSTSANDFASLNLLVATGTASFAIKNQLTDYPAGTFAGLDISRPGLLSIAALSGLTVSTYLNGTATGESLTGTSLLSATSGLLGGSGRQTIGFVTTKSFDEVKLTVSGANALGVINIYGAVFESFCAGPALACNTPTTLNSPTFPAIISGANTGFSGASVGSIENAGNAISASPTDFATLNLTANVGTASFAIKDQVTDYPAGTFAGIDISSPNLLNIAALSGLTVSTYLNGVATSQSVTGANLVAVGSTILSGSGRQTIGFIATQPFDEIKLTISGATVLGATNIYGAVFQSFCDGPALACNVLTPVTTPAQPVYIDGRNTGIDATACVGCSINNAQNAIDNDPSNFASIELTAGALTSASFAVANARATFGANSFAGFDIETASLLSAGALSTATISLYNDGSVVQTGTGSALIVGATTALLNGRSRQIVGIVANTNYDEVKITFNQLAGANLGTVYIYSAVFENTCPTTIVCNTAYNLSSPTFPVVINSARTGTVGTVSVAATVQDAWNVVSSSTTDFARITNTASVGTSTSISVLDPVNTFPVGTFAGFTVKRITGLVAADLFDKLTVTTYLDGVQQEARTGRGALLDLSVALFGSASDFVNVGFATTKAFDEVQLSVAPLLGLDVLGGGLDVYGAFIDTRTSTGGGLVCALNTNPDFTVTNINVPVSGSVRTNDNVPAGTTYGPAATLIGQPGGSTPTLTLNTDGSFNFTSATAGVYVYSIPVCPAGTTTGCQTQTLTVTVLNPDVTTNNPVANPDFATITGAAANPGSVTIDVTANDGPGNTGGTLGTPTIAAGPANGAASINGSGNLVYTPVAGFVGTDVVTYQVCETPGGLCATATVTIRVNAAGSPAVVSINDDYVSTPNGKPATGNLLDNDLGTGLTVSNPGTTITSSGTLVTTSTGTFSFTAAPGTTGPATFTYTACDNASNCGTATLHVLVGQPVTPAPVLLTNPDFTVTTNNVPVSGNVRTNDNVPAGTTYGPAPAPTSQPAGSTPNLTLNTDGSFNFTSATPGVYVYSIPVCPAGTTTGCQTQTLTVTVLNPDVTTNNPVANPDFATITGAAANPGSVTIDVTANDGPGNTGGTLGTPTIAAGPANGTASINGSGNLVYTPVAGFVGTDVVTYQVCETPGGLCATATVTIRVNAAGSPAVVSINDDYVSTPNGKPATGNLLDNDLGTGLTVSNPGTTITSSGTLVTTSTGTFSFTAAPGTTGPATFTYTACDNASNCGTATLHVLVGQPVTPAPVLLTNPDFTVTTNNVPVSGNVRTNDNVPAGTTYGPAPAPTSQPAGSTPNLTLNTDGSFNFTSATPGVYVYSIPVCPAGTTTGCQTQTLTVTVLNPDVTTNNPVANPDFATITGAAANPGSVTIDVTANDGPGNTGGTLGTPTIAAGPANGAASINGSGNLVYTPVAGFVGTDVVTYQVCETPGGLCATATVTIRVNAAGSPAVVSINDDYVSTPNSTSSTGNVLDNDLGTGLTVSNPGTTVTSSGTLVTTASGSFTFTPAAGVSGPATYTYTACDNASSCGTATLHVLVGQPLPDLTPTIELPSNNFTVSGAESVKNFTVKIEEVVGRQTASGNIVFTITAPFGYSLAFDNSLTNTAVSGGGGGNVPVDNTKWTVTSNNGLQLTLKINAGQFIPARGNSNIGFTITRTVTNSGTTSNITVNVADDASKTYDSKPENNIYSRNINAL